jgi:hypothetical protein
MITLTRTEMYQRYQLQYKYESVGIYMTCIDLCIIFSMGQRSFGLIYYSYHKQSLLTILSRSGLRLTSKIFLKFC